MLTVKAVKGPYLNEIFFICPNCLKEKVGYVKENDLRNGGFYSGICPLCKESFNTPHNEKELKNLVQSAKFLFKESDLRISVVPQKQDLSNAQNTFFVKVTHFDSDITVTKSAISSQEARALAILELLELVLKWKNNVKEISEMDDSEILLKLKEMGIEIGDKRISQEILNSYNEKTGKYEKRQSEFLIINDDFSYTGIYNSNGDALFEDFKSLKECVNWILNGFDDEEEFEGKEEEEEF